MRIQDEIQFTEALGAFWYLTYVYVYTHTECISKCMFISFKLTIQNVVEKDAHMNIADLNINKLSQNFCVKVVSWREQSLFFLFSLMKVNMDLKFC